MAPQLASLHIPQIKVSEFANDWDLDLVGRTFSDKVPGYRSTTTFLTTLRSNLQLSAAGGISPSLPPSAISTPTASAFTFNHSNPPLLSISASGMPLLAASAATMTTTAPVPPQDEIPDLSYKVAPADPSEDRVEALKLIADSVAQQRQAASRAVILHPATLAITAVVLGVMSQLLEFSMLVTTAAGVIMAGLLAVRMSTAGYIALAEKINFKWLEEKSSGNASPNGNRDPIVLVAKWGDEVIGALVMRVVKRERRGYVRAWTVKLKYRNKGIGRGLLEEAAKVVWGRGSRMMEFEHDHVNANRVLPEFFNAGFDKNEAKGRAMLVEVVAETKRERSSR